MQWLSVLSVSTYHLGLYVADNDLCRYLWLQTELDRTSRAFETCWSFVLVITGLAIRADECGVAIGSPLTTPFDLRTENVFFLCLSSPFFFCHFILSRLPEIYRLLKHQPLFLLAGLIVAGVYCLCLLSIILISFSLFFYAITFCKYLPATCCKNVVVYPIFLAILLSQVSALAVARISLYPFWLLALLPVWLIETRYYIRYGSVFVFKSQNRLR